MAPFEALVRKVVRDAGITTDDQPGERIYLPGYYRETKSWDVVLQYKGHALAIIEAKSQGSSLANNFNNRVEEAIGQAADVWKSHERGLLVSGLRPWIGYVMVVEETAKTVEPKNLLAGKAVPAGMVVDPVFNGMSYADRYAMAFKRLDQERMLDATCVAITSSSTSYSYPNRGCRSTASPPSSGAVASTPSPCSDRCGDRQQGCVPRDEGALACGSRRRFGTRRSGSTRRRRSWRALSWMPYGPGGGSAS